MRVPPKIITFFYLHFSSNCFFLTSAYRGFANGHRGQNFVPLRGNNHFGWNHGGGNRWNQQEPTTLCNRPTFTDDAQFIIDNCDDRNSFSSLCRDTDTGIPSDTKATMLCKLGSVTLRYSSTCLSSGNWNPGFYESCRQLQQQSFGQNSDESVSKYTDGGTSFAQQEEEVSLRSCLPLQVQSSKNFIFSCTFPGTSETTEGCRVINNVVPSGTVATLKCRPPFSSQRGVFSEWTCENGKWLGESKKVVCFYSSLQPSQEIPTKSNSSGSFPNQGRFPVTVPPLTSRPIELKTTKTPAIQPTRQPPILITQKPSQQTTDLQAPAKSVTCPALKHRSPGVKIECVSGGGSAVSENTCNNPQPVGTEAKYSCLTYYEAAGGLATVFRKCRTDGRWTGSSETFSCNTECGRANQVKVAFITNGLPTVRGQFPWHAAMFFHEQKQNSWSYICGATLIGRKAILTAAHCVTLVQTTHVRPVHTLRIDFGKFKREEIDDLVQSLDVGNIYVHPSYNPYGYDSDIAVVTLKSEVKVGYHVRPICFPQTSDSALEELQLSDNSIGTVVGFGYNEQGQLAEELQMTKLRIIGPRECSESIKSDVSQIQTRSTTYCAGFKNGTNVCNGDSGGGMYFPSKSADHTKWYLQGLVSVGISNEDDGRCDAKKPSVFTRIGRYADWIVRTLSENEAQ